jgi:hypothetical protein
VCDLALFADQEGDHHRTLEPGIEGCPWVLRPGDVLRLGWRLVDFTGRSGTKAPQRPGAGISNGTLRVCKKTV